MSPYELLAGGMNAQVSNGLGDSISVMLKNGETKIIMGFVTLDASELGIAGVDPMPNIWHCKIDKHLLPDGPQSIARLTAAKLAHMYRPGPDNPIDSGNSWIFDLQKATL